MNEILYLANHKDKGVRGNWMNITRSYETQLHHLTELALLKEVFLNNRMAKSSIVKVNSNIYTSPYSSGQLYIYVWFAPVEMVIDFFCSIGKQKLGMNWTLEASEGVLRLESYYKRYQVTIQVNLDEFASCKIVKKVREVVPTPSTPDIYHDYFVDCAE